MKTTFPNNWFEKDIPPHVNLDKPGIYEWCIDGNVYIGKSKRLRGRLREYPNNVRKLVGNAEYRKSNPQGFRPIHKALRIARDAEAPIIVTVLENCDPTALSRREQLWIAFRREEEKSGGPRVLNAETPPKVRTLGGMFEPSSP